MSKLRCECSGIISDSSTDLPYKAHIVPDSLLESFMDRTVTLITEGHGRDVDPDEQSRIWHIIAGQLSQFSLRSYQCPHCSRILIRPRAPDQLYRSYLPEQIEGEYIFQQ